MARLTRREFLVSSLVASSAVATACSASPPTGSGAAFPATAAPTPAAPAQQPTVVGQTPETLKVAFAADAAIYAPHFIAITKGYYDEENIRIEIVDATGGVSTPALISGDLESSTSAASAISAIIKGAPLRVVYTNTDYAGYELWTNAPDIQSVADLPGKTIGIGSRGDSNEVSLRIFLPQQNVDPNTVSFTPLGPESTKLAALQSGAVQAALLATASGVQLSQQHIGRKLADIKDNVKLLYTGLVVRNDEIQSHADRLTRLLRGTIKGREYYKAFRDETLQILGQYNHAPGDENATDYDDVLTAMTPDGSMPADVQESDAAAHAAILGLSSYPPVGNMYDYSLVKQIYQELQTSGWQPAA